VNCGIYAWVPHSQARFPWHLEQLNFQHMSNLTLAEEASHFPMVSKCKI